MYDQSSSGAGKRPSDQALASVFKRPKLPSSNSSNELQLQTFATVEVPSSDTTRPPHRRAIKFHALDAYTRHKLLVNYYHLTHPDKVKETFSRDRSRDKTDFEVLLENHRFIWSDEDLNSSMLTWGQRVAKKYYEKLFKEYCIIDLTRYKENKFGMRWRTEAEVLSGKGQFSCGGRHCSVTGRKLSSWEVKFAYEEQGEKKLTFVKVRLCSLCADKLNWLSTHKKPKPKPKTKRFKKLQKELDAHRKSETERSEASASPKRVKIKEEILTDVEDNGTSTDAPNPYNDSNYQDLIDQIWKQPVKLEPEETETALEDEVDDYLNLLFD